LGATLPLIPFFLTKTNPNITSSGLTSSHPLHLDSWINNPVSGMTELSKKKTVLALQTEKHKHI
jgi:hypothetical protein